MYGILFKKENGGSSSMAYKRKKRRRRKKSGRLFLPLLILLCGLIYFYPEPLRQITAQTPEAFQEIILDSHLRLQSLLDDMAAKSRTLLDPANISQQASREQIRSGGSEDFEVHYLDVGEGLSVLIESGDAVLLYDGGDRSASSFVVSYLKNQGITHLDYVIASHYDSDHLNGVIGTLHAFTVDTVLGPDYEHDSKTYDSFLQAVSDAGLAVTHPAAGAVYPLGDADFTVLAPQEISQESNNNSIAIRIVNGDNSFLLTGDAQTESEEAMCSLALPLKTDVICPGHHGSYNATSELFLDYTQPEYAVISCGADNEYGHPHQETLQRLADHGVTVFRTDELGTIIAHSDGKNITWEY